MIEATAPENQQIQVGWAQLLTNGSITGFAVFTLAVKDQTVAGSKTQQEAVVPLENRNAGPYILWFDNMSGYVTGVALANVPTQPAAISMVIRDNTGTMLSTQIITLPAQRRASFNLTDRASVTANRRGTLEFKTPLNGRSASSVRRQLGLIGSTLETGAPVEFPLVS